MVGYDQSELPNRFSEVLQKLLDEDDSGRVFNGFTDFTDSHRQVFDTDCQIKHKAGHRINVLLKAFAVRDEEGCPQRIVGTFSDITARKQIELRLVNMHKQLEERIQMRTEAFQQTNRDLFNDKRKAEIANRLKSECLVQLAHETETALCAIRESMNAIDKSNFSKQDLQYIQSVFSSTSALYENAAIAMELPKLETSKTLARIKSFDVHSLLSTLISQYWPESRAEGIAVTALVDEDVPRVLLGDNGRIYNVLSSLLNNALRFSDADQIKVASKVLQQSMEGRYLIHFIVEDNGKGMNSDIQHIVRGLLSQDAPGSAAGGGAYELSFVICRQLVDAMEGRIWFGSVAEQGTTFNLEVPLYKGAEAELEMMPTRKHKLQKLPFCEKRILIGSKDETICAGIKNQLQVLGFKVFHVNSGVDAVRMVDKQQFDCVLIDLQAPKMDALSVTRNIRKTLNSFELPIIAIAANIQHENKVACLEIGMNDYLEKPFNTSQLTKILTRWINP